MSRSSGTRPGSQHSPSPEEIFPDAIKKLREWSEAPGRRAEEAVAVAKCTDSPDFLRKPTLLQAAWFHLIDRREKHPASRWALNGTTQNPNKRR